MENNYCIYMHKNKINGKIYIGQTCQKPEIRWGKFGKGYSKQPTFFEAILQYGWDNFEHIIIKNNLSKKEADEKEKFYINLYNTTNFDYGYNICEGGINNLKNIGKNKSNSSNKKVKIICLNNNKIFDTRKDAAKYAGLNDDGSSITSVCQGYRKNAGKDPKTKERLKWAYYNIFTGDIFNGVNEVKVIKGTKKVMCIETGKIFDSVRLAANWCGLKGTNSIYQNIKGKVKSAGKHPDTKIKLHWKYID